MYSVQQEYDPGIINDIVLIMSICKNHNFKLL